MSNATVSDKKVSFYVSLSLTRCCHTDRAPALSKLVAHRSTPDRNCGSKAAQDIIGGRKGWLVDGVAFSSSRTTVRRPTSSRMLLRQAAITLILPSTAARV